MLLTERTIKKIKQYLPLLINTYININKKRAEASREKDLIKYAVVLKEEKDFLELLYKRSKQFLSVYKRFLKMKDSSVDTELYNLIESLVNGLLVKKIDLDYQIIKAIKSGELDKVWDLDKKNISLMLDYGEEIDEVVNIIRRYNIKIPLKYKVKRGIQNAFGILVIALVLGTASMSVVWYKQGIPRQPISKTTTIESVFNDLFGEQTLQTVKNMGYIFFYPEGLLISEEKWKELKKRYPEKFLDK